MNIKRLRLLSLLLTTALATNSLHTTLPAADTGAEVSALGKFNTHLKENTHKYALGLGAAGLLNLAYLFKSGKLSKAKLKKLFAKENRAATTQLLVASVLPFILAGGVEWNGYGQSKDTNLASAQEARNNDPSIVISTEVSPGESNVEPVITSEIAQLDHAASNASSDIASTSTAQLSSNLLMLPSEHQSNKTRPVEQDATISVESAEGMPIVGVTNSRMVKQQQKKKREKEKRAPWTRADSQIECTASPVRQDSENNQSPVEIKRPVSRNQQDMELSSHNEVGSDFASAAAAQESTNRERVTPASSGAISPRAQKSLSPAVGEPMLSAERPEEAAAGQDNVPVIASLEARREELINKFEELANTIVSLTNLESIDKEALKLTGMIEKSASEDSFLEEDKDRIVGIFEKIIQRWVAIQEEQAGNEPKQKIAYLEKVIDDLDRNPSIPGAWQKIVALRSLVDRLSTTAQPSMQVFVDKILGFKEGLAACTDISVIEEEFLCIAKALRASALLVGVDRIMEPLKSASFVIEAIVEKWVQFTESETTGHNLQEKIYFLQDRCRSLDSERSQLSRDSQNIINVVLLMKKVALSKRIIQLFRERMKATVSFSDLMALKRDLEGFYQILDSDSDERTSVTNLIAEVQREVDKFNQ